MYAKSLYLPFNFALKLKLLKKIKFLTIIFKKVVNLTLPEYKAVYGVRFLTEGDCVLCVGQGQSRVHLRGLAQAQQSVRSYI